MHRCIAILLLLLIPSPAFAWSRRGHRIIAAVAERRLGPNSQALKEALKILGVKHLADVAARPDDWVEEPGMKQTAAWHFVNIPFDEKTFDADRDCPRSVCLVSATNHFLDLAIDSVNPNALMRTLHTRPYYRGLEKEALIFLIHFLGDIHQPMHCETGKLDDGSSDHNATLIHVKFNGGHIPGNESGDPNNDNLHFVWDVSLIEWEKLDEQAFVDHLIDVLGGGDRPIGATTEVANNSHEYARFEGVMVKDHTDLNAAYMDAQTYIVDEELLEAGIAVAKTIQRIFNSY